jgi:predicted nucleic acid-binding protein
MTSSAAMVPFDESAAVIYAHLRGDRSLRPPDAIQLACASSAGVDLFITNDRNLHTKQIPGIQFIASLERVPI